jgi:hypothetical protein
MYFIDRFRPENNQCNLCLTCPDRTGSFLDRCAARIALMGYLGACESGPVVTNVDRHIVSSAALVMDVYGTIVLPKDSRRADILCGMTNEQPAQPTETIYQDGELLEIRALKGGELLYPLPGLDDASY